MFTFVPGAEIVPGFLMQKKYDTFWVMKMICNYLIISNKKYKNPANFTTCRES